MPKPAKSATAIKPEGKPSGRKAMAIRAEQGLHPSHAMQVPHKVLDSQRRQKFLQNLESLGSFAEAAQLTDGYNSAKTFRRLQQNDRDFREACDSAIETFGSKILAVLRDEVLNGTKTPIVSNGEILAWIKKRDPKLILAYARRIDAAFKESKTVVNVDGTPQQDPRNPSITITAADMWVLNSHESETLLDLARKIMAARNLELGFDVKDISPKTESDFEDVEFTEPSPVNSYEAPEDRATPRDSWEDDES